MAGEVYKEKSLKHVLSGLRKKYGDNLLKEVKEVPSFSTGLSSLDAAIGCGGFPRGRITELFSMEGCGKSTLAMQAAVSCQREGLVVVMVDFERVFQVSYAEKLGLDCSPDKLIVLRPDYGEEGFDACLRLTEAAGVGMIIIDSVAAAVPKSEAEILKYGSVQPGVQSRLVGGFIKVLNAKLSRQQICVVMVNQLRSQLSFGVPGQVAGPPKMTTPGGNTLKFYASLRLQLKKGKQLQSVVLGEDGTQVKQPVGLVIKARVEKNKMDVPYRTCELELVHGYGLHERGAFDYSSLAGECKEQDDFADEEISESLDSEDI